MQEWVGHGDVKTTMIYTHVLNRGGEGVESPADRLLAGYGSPVSPPAAGGLTSGAGDHVSAQALDNEGKNTLPSRQCRTISRKTTAWFATLIGPSNCSWAAARGWVQTAG